MSGIFEQFGEAFKAVTNPEEALKGMTDSVKEQAGELSNDVFKKALDSLGLTSLMESLSKVFPLQTIFPFLTGEVENKEASKDSNTTPSDNLGDAFSKVFKESLNGNIVQRFLNNKRSQHIKVACYNLAENFRWKQFGQNLFTQQPSFKNTEEKEEMQASKYLVKEIDSYPVGTVFWVQANIDPSDVESRHAKNGNHWLTYMGKNQQGEPLIADQNGVRPVKDNDFYSKRYVHKAYPPVQTA